MRILNQGVFDDSDSFNALYLRMRCHECLCQWDNFDEDLGDLLLACETDLEDNTPSCHHRKVLWTTLINWRRVSRGTWIGSINSLLDDLKKNEKLFLCIRSIAIEDSETKRVFNEGGGTLAMVLCDEFATNEEIHKAISDASESESELDMFMDACFRLK